MLLCQTNFCLLSAAAAALARAVLTPEVGVSTQAGSCCCQQRSAALASEHPLCCAPLGVPVLLHWELGLQLQHVLNCFLALGRGTPFPQGGAAAELSAVGRGCCSFGVLLPARPCKVGFGI